MQKQLVFLITAAALMAAIGSVALYTVHIANAQSNMTSGAKNMTGGSNMTGSAGNTTGSNMTGGAGNTTGSNMTGASGIPTTHPAGSNSSSPDDQRPQMTKQQKQQLERLMPNIIMGNK